MVVVYDVVRPRGLTGWSFRKCRQWRDERSPNYVYDYRLFDADGVEASYWIKGGAGTRRPYLMVTLVCSSGARICAPLHKLFAFNSPVCNPGPRPICWSRSGSAQVHHGGKLSGGRNNREANLEVKTRAGHRLGHRRLRTKPF